MTDLLSTDEVESVLHHLRAECGELSDRLRSLKLGEPEVSSLNHDSAPISEVRGPLIIDTDELSGETLEQTQMLDRALANINRAELYRPSIGDEPSRHRRRSSHRRSRRRRQTKLTDKDAELNALRRKAGLAELEPFSFCDSKPHDSRSLQEYLDEKREEEERLAQHTFKATPIPRSTKEPLLAELSRSQQLRREQVHAAAKEATMKRARPFSFYERDLKDREERLKRIKAKEEADEEEALRLSQSFKANPIRVVEPVAVSPVDRETKAERQARLLAESKLPPRMQMWAEKEGDIVAEKQKRADEHFKEKFTFTPDVARKVPNFGRQQADFERTLARARASKPVTKPLNVEMRTSLSEKSLEAIKQDIAHDEMNLFEYRWPYLSKRAPVKPTPIPEPTTPPQVGSTRSTELRNRATREYIEELERKANADPLKVEGPKRKHKKRLKKRLKRRIKQRDAKIRSHHHDPEERSESLKQTMRAYEDRLDMKTTEIYEDRPLLMDLQSNFKEQREQMLAKLTEKYYGRQAIKRKRSNRKRRSTQAKLLKSKQVIPPITSALAEVDTLLSSVGVEPSDLPDVPHSLTVGSHIQIQDETGISSPTKQLTST